MFDQMAHPLLLFLLCMVRPLTAFRTAPLLGGTIIPPQALTALGMSLCLLIYPIVAATAPVETPISLLLLLVVVKELLVGLIIGFLLGVLFWAAESLGALIDNQRGASMAVGADPLSGGQMTPYASLFFQSVAMLFFQSGAFVSFLVMLMESYAVWPVFAPLPGLTGQGLQNLMLLQADLVLRLAVSIGAPILALCFFTDFCLGLINRFAQQLNVFVLSMPIKSGVVLFVLIVYASTLLGFFNDGIRDMDVLFGRLRESLR